MAVVPALWAQSRKAPLVTTWRPEFIPIKPAIVTATLGDVRIADVADDPIRLVIEYFELGPDLIEVQYIDVVKP